MSEVARSLPAEEVSGVEIAVQNPQRYRHLQPQRLRRWLGRLVQDLAPETASLGIRFVSDEEMQQLNRQYRSLDATTDVLSFPGEELADGRHLGDIVISVPTARRQAAAAGIEADREIRSLLLHGVLHCLGHDHETDEGQMRRLEDRLRERWLADVD